MGRIRKKSVIAIFATAVPLLFLFQNCSKTSFRVADQEVSSSSVGTKTLSIKIENAEVVTEKDINVLLVIDNSPSMMRSIDNLSRNVSSVLDKIKTYNAKVKIITTDEPILRPRIEENFVYDPSDPTKVIKKSLRQIKMPSQRIFSYNKNESADQQDKVTQNIKSAILSVGQQGSSYELPLLSIAAVVKLDDFFKNENPSLVYVISDEDDGSAQAIRNVPYIMRHSLEGMAQIVVSQYYTFKGTTVGEGGILRNRAPIVLSMAECEVRVTQFLMESGNPVLVSPCAFVNSSLSYTVQNSCEGLEQAKLNGTLASSILNYYNNRTSCNNIKSWTPVLSEFESFYGKDIFNIYNTTLANETFLKAFKDQLDSSLGSKYIFAASINVPGQLCALKTDQSYGHLVLGLQNLYKEKNPNQFLVSSICQEQDIATNLDKIAKEFGSLIEKSYSFNLEISEKILNLIVVSNSGARRALNTSDYSFVNGRLVISDTARLTVEDSHIEVVIESTTTQMIQGEVN